MIDLATLVLVTTVVGACELVVLLALSRIVRVYRGPLLWAAGVALIILGNLFNVLRADAELEQVAAVLATAAFAGGLVANELGFRRFLDLPERRALLGTVLVLAVGSTVVGEVAAMGPYVRIAAEQRGDTVTLSVADDGIGIPVEQQERIFEVFTRLQTQDAYPGSGIGLSIVRKAAGLMDGEISISSVVGEGSIFRLALPAA